MADTLKVTLVKSPIGAIPKHRKTVEALGLTKLHKTVELPNNAATKGMIQQVGYSVVMDNGSPTLKEMADYIAPKVTEDGLYKAFEKLNLL